MGRPAKFGRDQILDATLEVVAEAGPSGATMAAIAKRLGAPTGSLYHRFGSRDHLLAELWLRTVRRFQEGVLDALNAGDLAGAALHTPRWCREHPAEASVLLLYRREELAARWPDELGEALATANVGVQEALEDLLAARPELDRDRVLFALVDVPYGAVRRHLVAGRPPPPLLDDLILSTLRAVLP